MTGCLWIDNILLNIFRRIFMGVHIKFPNSKFFGVLPATWWFNHWKIPRKRWWLLDGSEFAPENQWLEDEISFWDGLFSGTMLVSRSVSGFRRLPNQSPTNPPAEGGKVSTHWQAVAGNGREEVQLAGWFLPKFGCRTIFPLSYGGYFLLFYKSSVGPCLLVTIKEVPDVAIKLKSMVNQ